MRAGVDPDDVAPKVTAISIARGVVLGVAMTLLAGPLAEAMGAPEAVASLRVMSVCVVLVGLFAVPSAQLVRELRQDWIFIATLAGVVPANVLLRYWDTYRGVAGRYRWRRWRYLGV